MNTASTSTNAAYVSQKPRKPKALRKFLLRGMGRFLRTEIKNEGFRGLWRTISGSYKSKGLTFSPDHTLGEELAARSSRLGNKTFIKFEGKTLSYSQVNEAAARTANFLESEGVKPGVMVGIMMPNVPSFIEIFFATQRLGSCAVPINTGLKDKGLAHIINNAGVSVIFTIKSLLPEIEGLQDQFNQPLKIIVVKEFESDEEHPSYTNYSEVLKRPEQIKPASNLPASTVSILMYTSGTTGLPKGVVYKYGTSQAKAIRILGHFFCTKDDTYYTCLPLFHANALMITMLSVLYSGAQIALSRKFSASQFWQEIYETESTIFNTLGTMVAIMLKQEKSEYENKHKVKRVVSAACPPELWETFEHRYGVNIIESYGAVDGGGILTMNANSAPIGSVGKPLGNPRYKLIDENGDKVPTGMPGELVHYVGGDGSVDYHKNEGASAEKVKKGWVHSGDQLTLDKEGNLYFAGRSTDSMRCGGENVSAMEVESVFNSHSDVLESAAIGVPSEMGEEDIMVILMPGVGKTIDPEAVRKFAENKLPKYALPRYIRVVDDLPKTETHRIIKHQLKSDGVTADTWKAPAFKKKTPVVVS